MIFRKLQLHGSTSSSRGVMGQHVRGGMPVNFHREFDGIVLGKGKGRGWCLEFR